MTIAFWRDSAQHKTIKIAVTMTIRYWRTSPTDAMPQRTHLDQARFWQAIKAALGMAAGTPPAHAAPRERGFVPVSVIVLPSRSPLLGFQDWCRRLTA